MLDRRRWNCSTYWAARSRTVPTLGSAGAGSLGGGGATQAQGSGFVYDNQGHIITNQHVVDGAESVSVRFSDGSTHDATVVGSDPSTDLAVLKVDAPASLLKPLRLGKSSELAVGDGDSVSVGGEFLGDGFGDHD